MKIKQRIQLQHVIHVINVVKINKENIKVFAINGGMTFISGKNTTYSRGFYLLI